LKRYTALMLSVAAAVSVGLSACSSGGQTAGSEASSAASQPAGAVSQESKAPEGKLQVSVSFNAMKEFAE
ncbi:MAG TPA: ABC transporter substrate-binding protein, partial [Ruminococcaceae bacterium]|nr:ABC transporter substrate-binding protein [Oscillospiraceae bacterium]